MYFTYNDYTGYDRVMTGILKKNQKKLKKKSLEGKIEAFQCVMCRKNQKSDVTGLPLSAKVNGRPLGEVNFLFKSYPMA